MVHVNTKMLSLLFSLMYGFLTFSAYSGCFKYHSCCFGRNCCNPWYIFFSIKNRGTLLKSLSSSTFQCFWCADGSIIYALLCLKVIISLIRARTLAISDGKLKLVITYKVYEALQVFHLLYCLCIGLLSFESWAYGSLTPSWFFTSARI